jgi:tetratricopeptide (TPR) repeat protein
MFSKIYSTLIAAVLTLSVISPAPAMSSGGDSTTIVTPNCKKGKIWSKKKKKCVKIKKSSLLDDENIYQTGRDLAMHGRYNDAIQVLSYAYDKSDPRVLNYLGYAHRKSGRIDVGIGYYKEALRIDPDYILVREYMGEAFLQKGDLVSAKVQLKEIKNRCGLSCPEYTKLAMQIAKFKLN